MAEVLEIQNQWKPGLRYYIQDYATNPIGFFVPPKRQLQQSRPMSLSSVLTDTEWNSFRSKVAEAYQPLMGTLYWAHPLNNVLSIFGAIALPVGVLFVLGPNFFPDVVPRYGVGMNQVPLIAFFAVVFFKVVVIPGALRPKQTSVWSRLEEICAEVSSAHPGHSFSLLRTVKFHQGFIWVRVRYTEVSIQYQVGASAMPAAVAVGVPSAVPVPAAAVPAAVAVPMATAVAVPASEVPTAEAVEAIPAPTEATAANATAPAPKFCGSCGKAFDDAAPGKFCASCGAPR